MKIKHVSICAAALVLALVFPGCQEQTADTPSAGADASGTITLNGTSISSSGGSVTIDKTTATITAAGTYTVTGTLDDGQIIVDSQNAGTVTLVLDNADISCQSSAPIYVKAAGHVVITLADGSSNTVTDGSVYTYAGTETEPDAAIFSKADLVMNGQGALTVNANCNDGITSKDTLLIESGNITVSAKNHGIKGKDYLMISGGDITVSAGGDGIKATNDTQASLGYVQINGGVLEITAADDGISAVSLVQISGGTIRIDTQNNGIKSENAIDIQGGTVDIQTDDDGLVSQTQTGSANAAVTVNGKALSLE